MQVADLIPQFTDGIVKSRLLNIGYLHLVESCMSGSNDCNGNEQFDFAYKLWDGPLLVAGGIRLMKQESSSKESIRIEISWSCLAGTLLRTQALCLRLDRH